MTKTKKQEIVDNAIIRCIQNWFEPIDVIDKAESFARPLLFNALERIDLWPWGFYYPEEENRIQRAANRLYEVLGYSVKDIAYEINHQINPYSGKRLLYDALPYMVEGLLKAKKKS